MAEIDVRAGRPGTVDAIRYSDLQTLQKAVATNDIEVVVGLARQAVCKATVSDIDDLIRALQAAKRIFANGA